MFDFEKIMEIYKYLQKFAKCLIFKRTLKSFIILFNFKT